MDEQPIKGQPPNDGHGRKEASSSREVILEVLSRAADDHRFLARLAENPHRVLREYDLTPEERAALARGDTEKVESWVGTLDERLKTWLKVRLTQERW
jgi:hypothetical protein